MKRAAFLQAMRAKLGAIVLWAAKGPHAYDCSGAVTVSLREAGGPDLTQTHSASRLYDESAPIAMPQPGDLAFWSSWSTGPITHVAVVDSVPAKPAAADVDTINAIPLISADGASKAVDLEHATESETCRVRRHASVAATGRGYFRGFRRFKYLEE